MTRTIGIGTVLLYSSQYFKYIYIGRDNIYFFKYPRRQSERKFNKLEKNGYLQYCYPIARAKYIKYRGDRRVLCYFTEVDMLERKLIN